MPQRTSTTVANRQRSQRKIPKVRRVLRSPSSRVNVTRAEYNRIVDTLNERNLILNALSEAQHQLERDRDVQFKRIAQIQAELDEIKRAWGKVKLPA